MTADREAWFRSADWDAAARDEFERRLARAKPANRHQYLRIKGITLARSSDPVAREAGCRLLATLVAADDAPNHEKVIALSVLGQDHEDRGRFDEAERCLRQALSRGGPSGMNGGTGEEKIRLAELLLRKGDPDATLEAQTLLDQSAAAMPLFPRSRFRLCVAEARVSVAVGDPSAAADWARAALTLARQTDSGLAYHPTLGLVETDEATIAWLSRVAGGPTGRHPGRTD